jgi:hypothetical protein
MRAWHIDHEIDAMLTARRRAYERCTSVTARPRDVIVSGSYDSDTAMIALLNIEALIDERVDRLTKIKAEILGSIEAVPDCTLRTLLIERYINFKTWEQIAVDMNYNYRWIIKLHGHALQEIKTGP